MIFKELSVARNSLRHESGYLKKAIMKSFIFKKKDTEIIKNARNSKTIGVNCTKKNQTVFQ